MPENPAPLPISERGTLDQASPSSASSFGRYKLLQRLGEGGMGEVWLAEQTEPVHRQVALKVIKAGMDSAQVVARFEAERQALALMDHPTIATVFDGGTTPRGRPYFSMEYVKGEPITAYCDRHRLSTHQRLELLTQVCEGVQHAHQKGIIHRDLKPSNVLVTIQDDRPVPKIIDFGVARATVQHLTERSLFTELGVLVGTPEYMSPEQAEMGGLDIDTRTDIYALGVLLYELLTGVLPFDRKELRLAGLVEIQRMIREKEPPRPSTRITQHGPASTEAAKNRHTEPRRLVSELRGDLDWITMRALEKDRTRRYQTANALGADVRRHLNSEPVSAGPPGALYRARKFVRRHRFGVAASGMLCLLLALFAVGSTYQAVRIAAERDRANQERDRANKEAETARRVTALLVGLFKAADPAQARGADLTAREVLGRGVATLEHELDDQPEVHARLLGAISDAMLGLGLYREAEAAARRMLAIYSSLQGAHGMDTLRSGRRLCGLLVEQRRLEEADPICRQTLEGLRNRAGTEAHDLPNAVAAYAYLMFARGRLNEAELLFRESVEMRRRTFGTEHASTRLAIQNLAAVLQVEGQYSEAERLYGEALAAGRTRLGADHPDQLMTLSNLAEVLQEQGRFEEAEPRYREALAGERRVLPADHDQTATTLLRLASLLCQTQRFEEALPLAQDALGIYTRALSASDWRVADAKSVLGEAMTGLLRYREAEPLVIAGEAGILSSSEPSVAWKRRATERVVDLYEAWGKPDRAREWRAKLEAQTPR